MRKRRTDGDHTKDEIVAAAKELFFRNGYSNTSLEDLSAATGRSKGNIYYHFKSKELLFIHILEQTMAEWVEQWEVVSEPYRTSVDKLFGLADYFVDTYQCPLLGAAKEYERCKEATPEGIEKIEQLKQLFLQPFENLMQAGMAGGEFAAKDPKHTAILVSGMFVMLSDYFDRMDRPSLKSLYRETVNSLLDGLNKRKRGDAQ